jgi:hypothetical protein
LSKKRAKTLFSRSRRRAFLGNPREGYNHSTLLR